MPAQTHPLENAKLIIQIPCYNEEKSLPVTLKALPRRIEGIGKVEWLVIDDGSTDKTTQVAQENGADHIVRFKKNQGLSSAFLAGLEACLDNGADIIVNTDADNQYNADDIPKLIQPIIDGEADIVVGARPISQIEHFSFFKKLLQKMGSWVVKLASSTDIPDAPSGFRAFSRDAALRFNVFNNYTYTLETIIQAGQKKMHISWVPVRINQELRPSRLLKNIPSYLKKSVSTIVRIFVVYKPFRFFMSIGIAIFSCGIIGGIRFLYYYLAGNGEGHIQSLILVSILLGIGFQTMMAAFLADLLGVNRRLMEDIQHRIRLSSYANEHDSNRKASSGSR
jgi:glycosyltransferase involved in cell wall biosynthesis